MRARVIITALVTCGWVGACSKPAPERTPSIGGAPTGADRDIALVEAAPAELPVVSELEARHPPKPALVRRAERKAAAPARAPRPADVIVKDLVPATSQTTSAGAATPLVLATAPMPLAPEPGEDDATAGDGVDPQPEGVGRGPRIIIRGGSGRPDDPCALHGQRPRPGVAVNNVVPALGGGFLGNDRARLGGGGRTGMASFPRGGIR